MTDEDVQPLPRRKFLVVADRTEESALALHFAGRRAQHTGGVVTLLTVLEPADFQHWIGVENVMKAEAREEAEALLHKCAAEINRFGIIPELVIREGKAHEQILEQIKEEPDIAVLVLAAGTGREGPGPLVSLLAKELSSSFPIPVTIVPGNLTLEQLDHLA